MAQQLVACARQLFEGVPGSAEQKHANAWLMALQRSDEAWEPALHVLRHPPREHGHVLAGPVLVAMQIVRIKTSQEWLRMTAHQKHYVRDTLLSLLGAACTSDRSALPPPAFRVACVVVADIVVKTCREWPTWRRDLQQIVDASLQQKSAMGAVMFEEVVGAIPHQIAASMHLWPRDELRAVVTVFKREYEHVLFFARTVLSSIPDAQMNALQCLENWLVGCVATQDDFGIDAVQLYAGGLMDPLFSAATCDNDDLAQLAAEIVADAFASTSSDDQQPNALAETIYYAAHRLLPTKSLLETPSAANTTVARGLARIACSLAINHTATLFSPAMNVMTYKQTTDCADAEADSPTESFSSAFLAYLLACSAHRDAAVAAPTLEFWFFFLDKRAQSGSLWHLLVSGTEQARVRTLLGALVTALIRHCRFPQSFIDLQQLVNSSNDDHDDVNTVITIRKEIADTLLSLFAKWPGEHGSERNGNAHACVQGLVDLLFDATADVATVDALLFLLEYMIELFDIDSSDDSGTDVSDDGDGDRDDTTVVTSSQASEGIQLLQSVLTNAHALPTHPLVVHGLARYLRSLSTALVLPSATYIEASRVLARGLGFGASYGVAAHALLTNCASISKYTAISDRTELLETLVAQNTATSPPNVSTAARGDLLEATFHTMDGVSDSDFATLCNTVLTPLTTAIASASATACAHAIALLGRAIHGVQQPAQARALVDQVWPLVADAVAVRFATDCACRTSAVQLFLNVVPALDSRQSAITHDVLDLVLHWYAETTAAADMLRCISAVVTKEKDSMALHATIERVLPTLFVVFRRKLCDEPSDDLAAGERSITTFSHEQRNVDAIAAEAIEFFALVRHVLKLFPLALTRPRGVDQRSLFWHALRLGSILLEVDHQTQEITDAVCEFFLDACCAPQDACIRDVEQFAASVLRGAVSYFGAKRVHCRPRNVYEFLFQVLHSPRIPAYIQAIFHSALGTSLFASNELRRQLSIDAIEEVQTELLARRQRPRFRQYAAQLARHLEALDAAAAADADTALAKTTL